MSSSRNGHILPGLVLGALLMSWNVSAQAQAVEECGPAFPEWKIPFQVFDLFRDFELGPANSPQHRICPDGSPAYALMTLSGRWLTKPPEIFDSPRLMIAPKDRFIVKVSREKISSFGSTAYVGNRQGDFVRGGKLGVRAFSASGELLAEQEFTPISVGASFSVSVRTPIARYEIFAIQPPTGKNYLVLGSVNFWHDTTYIP